LSHKARTEESAPEAAVSRQVGDLFRRERERVFRVALAMLGDPEKAEDAASQAFLEAYRSWPSFRGHSKPSTWLHRIAVNVCLQMIRKRGVVETPLEESAARDPGARTEEKTVAREAVRRALEQLDGEHRAVVVLHEFGGYRYREIAAILDCPVGTVRSRLHYGMRRLRVLLEEELR